MILLGKLRRSLWGVSPKEVATFVKGDTETWKHLKTSALTVIEGYHLTLEDSRFEVLVPRLNAIEPEIRGFAYEGAGMGLTLLDNVLPWKNQLRAFLEGPGATHVYPVYIGVGITLARLHKRPERFLARMDPVLRWLAIDGYGFHEGFFFPQRYVEEKMLPQHLSSYAHRVFDQGVGRSLWFSGGADVEHIAATIATFEPARQPDLWSGVAVACAYAGGVDRAGMEAMRTAAGAYASRLAQGAAVSALARQEGSNPAPCTDLACELWCGMPTSIVAHLTDLARKDLPSDGAEPSYEIWRQRIEAQFTVQAQKK